MCTRQASRCAPPTIAGLALLAIVAVRRSVP
jgi:hypothetical protein